MTNLIVRGHEFIPSYGGVDVDFRFYTEDGAPVLMREGINGDGEEYHMGQVSSSFGWARIDAVGHFSDELRLQFPDGYSLEFEFTKLNGERE